MKMKYMDCVELPLSDGWPSYLNGFFKMWDGAVKFCYDEYNRVMARNEDGTSEVWYTAPEGERLPYIGYWTNACPGHPPLADLQEHHKDEEIYHYGGYTISHKSQWSYVCKRDGEEVWNFRCHSWRYTDISEWNDSIYFGTAGGGGYLYLLDLHTGKPILALKTGATVYIPRRENKVYVFQREKRKTFLVCVDLNDGSILDRVELPGMHNEDCALRLIGNTIHAVTYTLAKDRTYSHGFWHRVEI
jgi:outer membrane protein assembly factor BamB